MTRVKMIDPPEGHKYGFPRQIPEDVLHVTTWLVERGYPKRLIESYGDQFACRYWYEEIEDGFYEGGF